MSKNLTLAIDDDLLEKARILAVRRRTSVNEMVRSYLKQEVERDAADSGRADLWSGVFASADASAEQRAQHLTEGGRPFDRQEFYEEVMRERGLL